MTGRPSETGFEVRHLAVQELSQAPALLAPEGWDFSVDELRRLHKTGGAVGAFDGGRLAGFLTFTDVPPIRWIGNVVVSPHLRGKGVGARMVEKAVEDAPRAGLYAVEKAVTLYERLGFVAAGEAFAFRAEAAKPLRPSATEPITRADLLDVARYDRHETALDRGILVRELVNAYPDSARLVRQKGLVVGYGIAKTSPGLTELGPIVAATPRIAEDLVDALLAATPGPHEVTVLGANRHGVGNVEARGFVKRFRAVVMHRGKGPAWKAGALAAAAGLEKG